MVEIDAVARIMRETAAAEIMPRWRNLGSGDVVAKSGPNDIVTVADRAAEESLSVRLKDLVAGSEVVGEEGVHADGSVVAHFTSGAPVWVIDPIDGTSAFAKGDPDFAVMVALVRGEELLAGWILAPVSGESIWRSAGPACGVTATEKAVRLERPRMPAERQRSRRTSRAPGDDGRASRADRVTRRRVRGAARCLVCRHRLSPVARGRGPFRRLQQIRALGPFARTYDGAGAGVCFLETRRQPVSTRR